MQSPQSSICFRFGTLHRIVTIKYSDRPRATRSMHSAVRDLKLDHLWVVYPGVHAYPVHEQITAWPLRGVAGLLEKTQRPG